MAELHSGKDFTCARMMWLDQINSDREMTLACCKVAYHLSAYFNRKRFLDGGGLHAWPSHSTLANETGCSIKTIKNAVYMLRERGHLETTGGRGRSCTTNYRALLKPKVAEAQPDEAEKPENKTGLELPINDEKIGNSRPENRYFTSEKGGKNYLQPYLNKSLNKNTGASERENDPVTLHTRPVDAQCEPYNPEWALVVFEGLSRERARLPTPANKFLHQRIVVDRIHADVMEHQAKHGWPAINSMFEWSRPIDPASVPPAIRKMALEMEPVRNGSALWDDWRAEFRARGWPFPSEAKYMSFPRGGPDALDTFMQRLGAMRDGFADNVVAFMQETGS